jgi:hypothetical protein
MRTLLLSRTNHLPLYRQYSIRLERKKRHAKIRPLQYHRQIVLPLDVENYIQDCSLWYYDTEYSTRIAVFCWDTDNTENKRFAQSAGSSLGRCKENIIDLDVNIGCDADHQGNHTKNDEKHADIVISSNRSNHFFVCFIFIGRLERSAPIDFHR